MSGKTAFRAGGELGLAGKGLTGALTAPGEAEEVGADGGVADATAEGDSVGSGAGARLSTGGGGGMGSEAEGIALPAAGASRRLA